MKRFSSIVNPKSGAGAGIALMLLACLVFSLNDTLGKWLVATYTVGQLLLIRSSAAMLILLPFLLRREALAEFSAAPRPRLQILRVVLSSVESALFYWAVVYLPLADVVTFYLAGPIFVTAFSALLLKEQVGWRRWSAVLAGFAGVVIAMRPSAASFSWPALIALTGCVSFALLMIATRAVRGTSDLVLVTGQMAGALVLGIVMAPIGWVSPSARDFALLGLLGVVAMFAHVCVNRSLKLAPASVVVPYQYTFILWAIVFGYFVFGDVPDAMLLTGAAIIVAAGIFIFRREQVRAVQNDAGIPPPAA
jgi:drug/metabolite transporter (DMT)-like permease